MGLLSENVQQAPCKMTMPMEYQEPATVTISMGGNEELCVSLHNGMHIASLVGLLKQLDWLSVSVEMVSSVRNLVFGT